MDPWITDAGIGKRTVGFANIFDEYLTAMKDLERAKETSMPIWTNEPNMQTTTVAEL